MNTIIGQKLSGRYQILKQIGGGGFSFTFLAEDMQRPGNPQCVVKQFKPMSTSEYALRESKRLFDKEAEILEKLGNHDKIPRLLAHFEEAQEFYLVQEYIEGHDLSKEIFSGKKLSEPYVFKLLQDILEILIFVHQQGVIHRDIKPHNIIRRTDGKIVLIDFGSVKQKISSQILSSQEQEPATVVVGTVGYMPSEQSSGQPNFTSDIYAVGVIGIQALTGIVANQLPKDTNTGEIVWRNQAEVSPELANILDKMVRYYFRDRYQSAELALQAFRGILPTDLKPPQPVKTPINFLPRLGLALIVVVMAVIFYVFRTPISKLIYAKPETLLLYENLSEKIKIKYPQTWNKQDINNFTTGEVVTFVSPKQSDADNFQEKLTIAVQDFPESLEQFSKTSINDINKHFVEAKIISESKPIVANKQGGELVYVGKDGQNSLKNLQVFTLKNGKAYVITYTAKINNYNDFIEIAETMIKSFEIE